MAAVYGNRRRAYYRLVVSGAAFNPCPAPVRGGILFRAFCALPFACAFADGRAAETNAELEKIRNSFGATLCVVKLGLEAEDAKRAELVYPGVSVAPTGLTMVAVGEGVLGYPRSYFKRVEMIRPERLAEPAPAVLIGINELYDLAFVEPIPAATSQPFVDFENVSDPPPMGTPLLCLGLLDEHLGYRLTFEFGRVGATVGADDFTVSGVPTDAIGTLLFAMNGRLVGFARSAEGGGDVQFLARGDVAKDGFITQPRGTRAATLRRAVDFAVHQRRDWPEPWIGVAGLQVAGPDVCTAYGLSADAVALVIGAVVEHFPAAEAGLRPKDFIIRFNGRPLVRGATDDETRAAWTRSVKNHAVGETVTLGIWRDGREHSYPLRLAEAPPTETRADREFTPSLGLAVREIVFQDRFERRLGEGQHGVVVAHLVQSGAAETAELLEDDIIQKIDESPIADLAAYRRVITRRLARPPSDLVFSVLRGTSQRVIIRIELQAPRTAGP